MPYQQILQKYAYLGIFASKIHIYNENSYPTIFIKNEKKIEKLIILVIFVHFLRFSLILSRIQKKSENIFFR